MFGMYEVTKFGRYHRVVGATYFFPKSGEALPLDRLYRTRAEAEKSGTQQVLGIIGQAEIENDRRDFVAAYLARRAARVSRPNPQLDLFA